MTLAKHPHLCSYPHQQITSSTSSTLSLVVHGDREQPLHEQVPHADVAHLLQTPPHLRGIVAVEVLAHHHLAAALVGLLGGVDLDWG